MPEEVTPNTEPVSVPAEGTTPVVDPYDRGDVQFDRAYVEKLRHEAADYRTKYAPYRDTYDGVDPDVQEYLLDLNRQLIDDPISALKELEELTGRIRGRVEPQQSAPVQQQQVPDEELDRPLTRREWQEMQDRQQSERQQAEQMEGIYREAEQLGYSREDDDGELAQLLYIASHKTHGNMQKAHEMLKDKFDTAVEVAVQQRVEAIRSGAEKWPRQSTGSPAGSPTPEPDKRPEGMDPWMWTRRKANARLDAAFHGAPGGVLD